MRIFYFSGIIREYESFLVGPLSDGTFLPAKVTSIHRYRVPRRMVHAGQAATLCLHQIESSRLRKVCVIFLNYFHRRILLGYGSRFINIKSSSML